MLNSSDTKEHSKLFYIARAGRSEIVGYIQFAFVLLLCLFVIAAVIFYAADFWNDLASSHRCPTAELGRCLITRLIERLSNIEIVAPAAWIHSPTHLTAGFIWALFVCYSFFHIGGIFAFPKTQLDWVCTTLVDAVGLLFLFFCGFHVFFIYLIVRLYTAPSISILVDIGRANFEAEERSILKDKIIKRARQDGVQTNLIPDVFPEFYDKERLTAMLNEPEPIVSLDWLIEKYSPSEYRDYDPFEIQSDVSLAAAYFWRATSYELQGDKRGQFPVSSDYDYNKAFKLNLKYCLEIVRLNPELVRAQRELGYMYVAGEYVRQNYAEAAKWFRKAADHGDIRAQLALGHMFAEGWGVPQDYVSAYMWSSLSDAQIEIRNKIALQMTPTQIAEAQKLASEWKPVTTQTTN